MLDVTTAYDLTFLFPELDKNVGTSLRNAGEFSRVELDLLLDYAPGASGTFIDVGANVGSIALPFAKARRGWTVHAIEAHRGLSGVLHANAFNNRLWNVEVHHAAAGAAAAIMDFSAAPLSGRHNFGGLNFEVPGPREPVRVLTLDAFAPPDVQLVKVDVEGFEPEVLKGAAEILRARRTTWVVEAATATYADAAAATIKLLQDAGYELYWLFVPFTTPKAPKPWKAELIGDANVVALPPGAPNLWNLRRVERADEQRPSDGEAYEYLRRYGFKV